MPLTQPNPAADKPFSWSAADFRKPSTNRLVLLVGFLLPLALDVKKVGEEGGSALQALLVAISLLCGAVYFMAEWLSRDMPSWVVATMYELGRIDLFRASKG
jgi:hypothetical protein